MPEGTNADVVVSPETLERGANWLRDDLAPDTRSGDDGAETPTNTAARALRGFQSGPAMVTNLHAYQRVLAVLADTVLAESENLRTVASMHQGNDRSTGDRLDSVAVSGGSGHQRSGLDGF